MANRDVSLTPRVENVREATPIVIPVQFELTEIKNHFDESLESIKKQFVIADELHVAGKEDIPMVELEKAITVPESKEWFFAYVNELFASVVMQDWETIRDQLNLFGVQWKTVCMIMYPDMDEKHAIDECKKLLAGLYKRRNVIAHQNDRDHASAIQNDISKEYVTKQIEKINLFVESIHSVAAQL